MSEEALDRIHIRDLLVRCVVGVNPEERNNAQDVVFNITMHVDLRRACQSDRLDDTVDYKAIKKRVLAMAQESSYLLVERLAQRAADICLEDARVRRCEVSVDKPGALRFARSVAIGITREQPNAARE